MENTRIIKRKLASLEGCQMDLKKELPMMFKAFKEAVEMYQQEIVKTPPEARARAFEASLLNSKMIQSIQANFPRNWKFGRYKRFILNVEGYTVLFKKLNGKNMPMNIKTLHSSAISNQLQTSLFDNLELSINPILFFGYKKDRFGGIFDPKLVYIDEEKVQWILDEKMVENTLDVVKIIPQSVSKARPTLKKGLGEIKRASNSDNE
nr:hypothetical protein [Allomuricauda sp.]